MLITESTFKQGYLYKVLLSSNHFYYSVVINLNNTEVTLTDIPVAELDIEQDCDGSWSISYNDANCIMDVIEIGPILTYGEQIKLNYPELLI